MTATDTIPCPRCGKPCPIIVFGSGPIAVCDCDPWRPVIYEGEIGGETVTDFYEMRRNYESRKAQRFLLWTDRMTNRIAAACILSGAILLGIMLFKAWRG